jgi:hypothetical protein
MSGTTIGGGSPISTGIDTSRTSGESTLGTASGLLERNTESTNQGLQASQEQSERALNLAIMRKEKEIQDTHALESVKGVRVS